MLLGSPRTMSEVHVVFDQHHRHAARQPAHDVGDDAALGGRQSGGRLVQHEDRRGGRERHRQLELTLLPVGENRDRRIQRGLDAGAVERAGQMGRVFRAQTIASEQREMRARRAAERQPHSLRDRQSREQVRDLEGAA